MNTLIKKITTHQIPCYFISPHLDDAAFSAGGLISYLADKTQVTVITAFTRAGKHKHSVSALAYAWKCGFKNTNMQKFFSLRRKEDRELWQSLGVNYLHLPYLDALWRPKPKLNIWEKISSYIINDFRYIYPTHRLHISKGIIHPLDQPNLSHLSNKLQQIVPDQSMVFCPLGLGRHVDHIFVRTVCTQLYTSSPNRRSKQKQPRGFIQSRPRVIYWEDAPYNLYHPVETEFVSSQKLTKHTFAKHQPQRYQMYPAYKTQFGKLFNGETEFNLKPETYYL